MDSLFSFFAPRLRRGVRSLLLLTLVCVCAPAAPRGAAGATQTAAAPQADLTITKTGNESAAVGGTITYELVVSNSGPDDAVNVVLTDALPAHTTFVRADSSTGGTATFTNNTLTVSFDKLPAFESGSATLVVMVNGDTPRNTTIVNAATAKSDTADPEAGNNSATASTFIVGPFAGDLLISEFRLRGPGGAADEFVEVYNNSDTPHAVTASDGSAGYALVASDGQARCTILNGTVIPARGHFLCVNSAGYSLAAYPAGDGTTATGDATYTADIPDNAGLALFRTANPSNFTLLNRLDAVGSTAEVDPLYREGAGYPALSGTSYTTGIDYSFYRDMCGKGGSTSQFGPCPTGGGVRDTDNNAADFLFVDTSGASAGAGQRLGAPGPENLSSPTQPVAQFTAFNLDSTVASSSPPNLVRDFTPGAPNTSPQGTIEIRKRLVNSTGSPVRRLRFRVIDLSTLPAPQGVADLRPITSTAATATGVKDPVTCSGSITMPCAVLVQGTTLEQPPAQPAGGGFNSSLSADTVTLATALQPGESINIRFLLGVRQSGLFKFYVNVEALTGDPDGESPVPEIPLSRTGKAVRKQPIKPIRSN